MEYPSLFAIHTMLEVVYITRKFVIEAVTILELADGSKLYVYITKFPRFICRLKVIFEGRTFPALSS